MSEPDTYAILHELNRIAGALEAQSLHLAVLADVADWARQRHTILHGEPRPPCPGCGRISGHGAGCECR